MASTSSLYFSHSLIKALLCSSFFISAWFIYFEYCSYFSLASSLKFLHWSIILSSCCCKESFSTFCFSCWSRASPNLILSSVISSSLESRIALCFSLKASINRSCLSFLSLPSWVKVSSSLCICLRYWSSFSWILSLSKLASWMLFLLSVARF